MAVNQRVNTGRASIRMGRSSMIWMLVDKATKLAIKSEQDDAYVCNNGTVKFTTPLYELTKLEIKQ